MAPELEWERGPAAAERLFAAALSGVGGPGRALLVGELWERGPSRELLRGFARDVFGVSCGPAGEEGPEEPPGLPSGPPPDRRLRARLLFVLFRLGSVQSPAERRRLREVLRDLRQRGRGPGPAVVGVVVLPPLEPAASPGAQKDSDPDGAPEGPAASLEGPAASAPLGAPEPLLLALLSSVFLRGGPAPPPEESPLQTALYRPGDPRTALGVKSAACRALRAADTRPDVDPGNEQKVSTLLKCFPWRRRRNGSSLKAGKNISGEIPQHPDEGIALKALCEVANGNCEENHTDT
ncbi:uncharacterized protein C2orf72 homolog [Lissotriton helveticus]